MPLDLDEIERLERAATSAPWMLRNAARAMIARIRELEAERAAVREQSRDARMLASKWMEAHDRLKDGMAYSMPKPADLPESEARATAAEATVARLEAQVAERDARIGDLREERDATIRGKAHTEQWYATRLERIKDVAKRAEIWPEVAAIIANGSGTRQLEDGSFVYDPPTYAQQMNRANHRATAVEATVARLEHENAALRDGLRTAARLTQDGETT